MDERDPRTGDQPLARDVVELGPGEAEAVRLLWGRRERTSRGRPRSRRRPSRPRRGPTPPCPGPCRVRSRRWARAAATPPPPIGSRSLCDNDGAARATAAKSFTTSSDSRSSIERSRSIANRHGWLVMRTAPPSTGAAIASAPWPRQVRRRSQGRFGWRDTGSRSARKAARAGPRSRPARGRSRNARGCRRCRRAATARTASPRSRPHWRWGSRRATRRPVLLRTCTTAALRRCAARCRRPSRCWYRRQRTRRS